MNITLIAIGKTAFPYLKDGMKIYEERLSHYTRFSKIEIPDIKNASSLTREQIIEKEGQQILSKVKPSDCVVLMDERGKMYTSIEMAGEIDKKINLGIKNLIFVIGGAYGFSEAVYQRADSKISLSKMSFSHQMVRLIFEEQLYRAFTILKGEPYHHE